MFGYTYAAFPLVLANTGTTNSIVTVVIPSPPNFLS